MITFKDFLREESDPVDAGEFFHREAQPFINKAAGAGLMYRGFVDTDYIKPYAKITLPSGKVVDVGITAVRKDRRSRDLPTVAHDAFNTWMKDTFDIDGRTGSAFVLGEAAEETASGYGYLYVVIPQGEFKYLWSPKVNDLFRTYVNSGIKDHLHRLTQSGEMDVFQSIVNATMDTLDYRDTDLPQALQSTSEIMVECEYLLVVYETAEVVAALKEVLK
ncbi:hypothetical protein [Janthinobacterium sp.]|uniref:hypothetical protein n=1 Tax=Janthinobacterium sp. TaxID=1871054 RepID=UPI0026377440|nr:hypothetical protein [Janthinobacterium sp.]